MSSRLLWVAAFFVFVVLLLLLLFSRSGEQRPPTLLQNADGIAQTEFQLQDSLLLDATGLAPRTGYEITVERENGERLVQVRLSTDATGRIAATPVWYNIGVLPCASSVAADTLESVLAADQIRDLSIAGQTLHLKILKQNVLVRETPFYVSDKQSRPVLYAADRRGCPKSGFLIGEEDVWVVGKNFPPNSLIRVWAVPATSQWNDGLRLEDKTRQYGADLPPLFELKDNKTYFNKLLWPKLLTSIGSYDLVAEVISYPFGNYHARTTAAVQNIVANRSYTGFVIQRRQNAAEPLEMDIAGSVQSPFTFRSTFLTTEDVYVGVDPAVQPSYVGMTADVYIVPDLTDAQWTANLNLDLASADVTGYIEQIAVNGICGNCWKTLAWSHPLTEGKYDVVLDFNHDGKYTPGTDLIDALDLAGFTVAKIRVDSVSFNYTGSGAIGLYDDVNHTNITAPEYLSAAHVVKPAAWTMGGSHAVQVSFTAEPTVNNAQIWAQGALGGLSSSSSAPTVSFSAGGGQALFNVTSPPAYIDETRFFWDWKYKNLNGSGPTEHDMGQTGEHVLYTVLATPLAPQAQPWARVLGVACNLAKGRTSAATATRDIWNDFYRNAGGQYDTVGGSPQYAHGSPGDPFNLTLWLDHYNSGNIGVVNCYDMGKSVKVFANALGADALYTYVDPFGYLNCVNPIGRSWTNNPFYDSGWYNPNPIVPGNWDVTNGRSSFGNHGFTRLADQIYDGSGGQVDVDTTPDACASVQARDLDGNDSWLSNYRARVIDNAPASTPGAPADHNFTVQ